MRTSYLAITMSIAFIALFALLSVLLILENHSVNYVSHSNGVVTLQQNIPQGSKVKFDSYQRDSSDSIGVLITTNNLDSAFKLVSSTGASLKKNQIGRVISANIPQNQIDSLANNNDITEILPNRVVKAFSINEIYQTNAQIFQNSGYTGKGIVVAVLDTGINGNNIINAQDFVGSGTTNDENGHGTKIAEIISAMAPDVKFINAKVLDKDGSGSEASVISGINYAVDNHANIISLSLGGYFDDVNSPLVSAVEDAINKGIIVVVASGNCGIQGNCGNFVGVATPGNSPNAITVGAVNGNSAVSYSAGKNYGDYMKPDVVAPVSANSLSGTSASTPFVSGAAALILQKNKLNPIQVKSLIEQNAIDLGIQGKDVQFGSGKLNLNFSDLTPVDNKIETTITPTATEPRRVHAFSGCTLTHVDGDSSDTRIINLSTNSGTFVFNYDTYAIEDRIVVSQYLGGQIYDTGCVGKAGSPSLNLTGSGSTSIQVQVTPNCAGGTGTAWEYTVYCPAVSNGPRLSVPELSLEQNTSLTVDLTPYSDGIVSVYYGNCSIGGSSLNVNPPSGFVGLMICKLSSTKNTATVTQAVPIQVVSTTASDLAVSPSDIRVVDVSANKVNVTVHNIGRSSANNVDVELTALRNNLLIGSSTDIISSIQNKTSQTKTFTIAGIQRGDKLIALVDYNNKIIEYTKSNNRAENVFKKLDVYVDASKIEQSFRAPVMEYLNAQLNQYNIINSNVSADAIIRISYNLGDNQKGCSLGTVYDSGKSVNDAHTGLIFSSLNSGKPVINVCASRIEGLINAIRRMDKENLLKNKESFFDRDDLSAIAARDFMNGKTVDANLVKDALNGGISPQDNFVQANDGTLLRLRHYNPVFSQSFLDYLLGIDPVHYNGNPVVMAGGLWSDINAWDQAGKETAIGMDDHIGTAFDSIKYVPRDVWLIELTGGPNTECSTCNDYTYGDVYSKYWPALVGGVLKLTGKSQVDYVGHSNGGRAALDAMSNYNSIKDTTSYLTDGTPYKLSDFNSGNNVVSTFIGVGVPGNFTNPSGVIQGLAKIGNRINKSLVVGGILHPSSDDISEQILINDSYSWIDSFFFTGINRISHNLFSQYIYLMKSNIDTQPGGGFSVNKAEIIAGNKGIFNLLPSNQNDKIVSIKDEQAIYAMIGALINKTIVIVHEEHTSLTDNYAVKTKVKGYLNG